MLPFPAPRIAPLPALLMAAVLWVAAPATAADAQQSRGPAPIPPFSTELAIQTFDSVWHQVANTHYDPELGGVDWEAVRDELRPRAAEVDSNAELRQILSDMVGRLGLSHFSVFGPEAGAALEGGGSDADGSASGSSGPANPGVELRLVDDRIVVTGVRPGSPAERAGVRTGWIVHRIGELDPSSFPADAEGLVEESGLPEARVRSLYLPMIAMGALQGSEGRTVEVTFLDGADAERRLALDRTPPDGQLARFGYLPPFPVEVRDRVIPLAGGGEAAWIHFTGWFPLATPRLAEAVDRHRERQGIVLDLRGNPGGLGAMAMGIAGHFIDERVSLGEMRNREGTLNFMVSPQRVSTAGVRVDPFAGPVAILVDPLSASTSEIFAAGMQSLGRARIFGETTAGQALPAQIIALPNGDRLMHAVADYTAPGGVRLERRGVLPDEEVRPSRDALLAGEDPALERALAWIATHSSP